MRSPLMSSLFAYFSLMDDSSDKLAYDGSKLVQKDLLTIINTKLPVYLIA